MQVEVGTVLEGKVTGLAAFGAFVEIPGGKTGLVHISEVSTSYVNDIKDHLKEGQKVKVKVIGAENGKISLSVKQVDDSDKLGGVQKEVKKDKRSGRRSRAAAKKSEIGHKPPEEFNFGKRGNDMSFDDMLQKFKQDSDEKFRDLKRSNEGKRSGGYSRSY